MANTRCLLCEALGNNGVCDDQECQNKATILIGWDGTRYRRVKVSSDGQMVKEQRLTVSDLEVVIPDAMMASMALSSKQDISNASLSSLDSKLTGISTAGKQDTGNVSLASIDSKFTGIATAARQDASNVLLTSIDSKLTAQSYVPMFLKVSLTSSSTGTVIAATPCLGMKTFIIGTKTTGTILGIQQCSLQISPHDTDDIWQAAATVNASLVNQTVVTTAPVTWAGKRLRVTIGGAILSGSFDLYVSASG